ncbi:MAG: hypothetical protein ACNYNX_05885 [Leucobacter sp.]
MSRGRRIAAAFSLCVGALVVISLAIGEATPAFALRVLEDLPGDAAPQRSENGAAGSETGEDVGADRSGDGVSDPEETGAGAPEQIEQAPAEPHEGLELEALDAPLALDGIISPFAAPGNNYCTVPGVYSLDTGRNARGFPLDASASTVTGTFTDQGTGTLNGLAITPDGTAAYAVKYLTSGTNRYQVQRLDASGNSGSVISSITSGSPNNSGAVSVGAIDPTGTYYYFGNFTSSSGTNNRRLELFAVNIQTNTWIGQVGRVTMTGATNVAQAGIEGDIAFDVNGAMVILWGSGTAAVSRLYRIDTPPTTASTSTITPTQLAQNITSTNTYPWNGLAFDHQGNLWIQRGASTTQSYRAQLNPWTGALTNGAQITATNFVGNDLAGCGLTTRPYMTFAVRDTLGNPVGGATVQIQGPKTASGTTNANWGGDGAIRTVVDCVSAPCAAASLDQDPAPGFFKVDRVVGGGSPVYVSSNNRYRLRPATTGAPSGYSWETSTAWVGIPGETNDSSLGPAANAWTFDGTTLSYAFPDLVVEPYAAYCAAGWVYGISDTGQMLQISPTGVVTPKGSASGVSGAQFNGLGIGQGGTVIYAFNRNSANAAQGRVYHYDTATGTWSAIPSGNTWDINSSNLALVAGGVSPEGTYYAGGFENPAGDFRIWSLNAAGTAMVSNGYLDLDSYDNGDLTFDGEGNMYLIRGRFTGDTTLTTVFRVAGADLLAAAGTSDPIPYTVLLSQTSVVAGINGATYDASGRLYLGTASQLHHVSLPGTPLNTTQVTLSGTTFSSTDLASCSMPPMVKLQKELPDGRVVAADQFTLEMRVGGTVTGSGSSATITGGTSLGTATAASPASGVQSQVVGSFPIISGRTITFREAFANGASAANYASGYVCTIDGQPMTPVVQGAATAGSLTVPGMSEGKLILCTFKNSILRASKAATPVSGALVEPDGIVTYTLTFDNTAGLGAATVQHRDHLSDVLDDAFFVNAGGTQVAAPVVTTTGGVTSTWDAANQRINIGGTVAAGATGTLSFRVRVPPNQTDAQSRESSAGGYLLRNYLTRNTVTVPPSSCVPSTPAGCTEHPINAWKVDKGSLPADGARLHIGGNAHYRITASKLNGATSLKQLVLTDDLTHVFKTAGWAPDAAVPNGALPHGVYLFNAANQTIDLAGVVTAIQPTAVQDVTTPALTGGRWILTSGTPIDVPAQAVRVEMWFAVQAGERPSVSGHPQGIPYGTPDPWEGASEPQSGWKFVNYATGAATTGIANTVFNPNRCVTGTNIPDTSISPTAPQPADTGFPAQCRVQHELSANYFTIRKDAGGQGVAGLANDPVWDPDPTGLWNMIGHEFEIRDDVSGAPSSYPSVKLCRTDYDPTVGAGWDGQWISPALAGDPGRWDWGEGSTTLANLKAWNNAHPANQLPLCGLLYPISSGSQEGRWRSENLGSESDTVAGRYWLVETRAPDQQTRTDATQGVRDVPGVQLLAEPVPFVIWPEEGTPIDSQSWHGRSQLDVSDGAGGFLGRCDPSATVAARPTACVNPTGYLLIVKDAAPLPLPLTGGLWLGILTGGGALVLLAALSGALWWRRRGSAAVPDSPGGGGEAH